MPAVWTGHTAPARIEHVNGRKTMYWDITGTTVGVADEVAIDVPTFLTQTLLHVVRSSVGASTTVTPKVGTVAAFGAAGIDDQKTYTGAAVQRDQSPLSIVARTNKVVIRPVPDAEVPELRIVYACVEGHLAEV